MERNYITVTLCIVSKRPAQLVFGIETALGLSYIQGTVGQKSKLLILSEYVNKSEEIGGMWTNKNSYRENEALSDI